MKWKREKVIRGTYRKCAVCGKSEDVPTNKQIKKVFYALFPHDENRCREWLRQVGNPKLVFLPIEKLSTIRYVCEEHFTRNDFNRQGNRLKNTAIPNQRLTRLPLSDEQLLVFPMHMADYKATTHLLRCISKEHSYCKKRPEKIAEKSAALQPYNGISLSEQCKVQIPIIETKNKILSGIEPCLGNANSKDNIKDNIGNNKDNKSIKDNLVVPQIIGTYNPANDFLQSCVSSDQEFDDELNDVELFYSNDRYVKNETATAGVSTDKSRTNEENLVLHHQGFLNDKLRSVLHSHIFCAVCFESNKTFKSLDEELTIISDNWTQTILLKHVYTYVFKQTETSASGYICTECTTQLQQAYIFIKYSQLTSSLLNEYIDDAQSKIGKVHNLNKEGEKAHNKIILILKSKKVNKYLVDQKDAIEIIITCPSDNHSACECKGGSKCYKCKNIIKNTLRDEGIDNTEPYQYDKQKDWSPVYSQLKSYKKTKQSLVNKAICEYCSKIMTKGSFYHYAQKHSKIQCNVCKALVDEGRITNHIMKEHADDVYLCNICNNPFYTLNRIQIHARIMHDIHDTSTINWMDPPKRTSKAKEINDVKVRCPDCSETPCIHIKYLNTYLEQTLNHTFVLVKCADCDFVTRTKTALVRHANEEHLEHIPHICDQCGSQFYYQRALEVHITDCHQTKNVYICKYCDEQFESSDIVSNHETSCCSIERAYRCEHCTASFNTNKLLQKHHKRRHKEVFPCQYCNKEWLTEPMRNRHIARVHSGVRIPRKYKFICDICQEEFNSRDKLKEHIINHGPNVRYQCKICNTEYLTLEKLRTHNYLYHVNPRVVCNICGKQIKQVLLEQHLEEHKLDAEVRCDVCNRRYDNIARLRTHMNNHLNPRRKKKQQNKTRFKCQSCDYVSSRSDLLEHHTNKKHLNITPYACHECKRKCYGRRELQIHFELCHLPIKKSPCPVCGKEYHKKHLKGHMERHFGEKKYACSLCEEKFVTSHRRYIHVLRKHSEKSECCPLCTKKFSVVTDLRRHIIVVHWKDESKDANKFDPREVEGLENHYHLFPKWLERQNLQNAA